MIAGHDQASVAGHRTFNNPIIVRIGDDDP